jgi:hypothetical protein
MSFYLSIIAYGIERLQIFYVSGYKSDCLSNVLNLEIFKIEGYVCSKISRLLFQDSKLKNLG